MNVSPQNMFLAIINNTYSEVKADYSLGRRPDFELGKMIKKVCQSLFLIRILSQILFSLYFCSVNNTLKPQVVLGLGIWGECCFLFWPSVTHICIISLPGQWDMLSGFKNVATIISAFNRSNSKLFTNTKHCWVL